MISRTEDTYYEGITLYKIVTWRVLWIPVMTFKTRMS